MYFGYIDCDYSPYRPCNGLFLLGIFMGVGPWVIGREHVCHLQENIPILNGVGNICEPHTDYNHSYEIRWLSSDTEIRQLICRANHGKWE